MTAPIVEVRSLSKSFGRTVAVDSVSLQVSSGTVYGLVGPNGSGKTTLTRVLCGLSPPSSGSARVLGLELPARAEEVRRSVGYMSQRFSLYNDLTALENLEFFGRAHRLTGPALRSRIDMLVSTLKLGPHLDKRAMVLSGGWRQRLALATTVLHEPRLMFLDEPTAGVDPVARRDLWDTLFDLAATGIDIFVTTQYLDEVERCGEVGYMYLSRLMVSGTPQELKAYALASAGEARYFELACDDSIRAALWLRHLAECVHATVFGHVVHALVRGTADGLEGACRSAGFTGVSVKQIEPTLEDVFVSLTKAADAARG